MKDLKKMHQFKLTLVPDDELSWEFMLQGDRGDISLGDIGVRSGVDGADREPCDSFVDDICRTGDADDSGEEHRTRESVRQWRSCDGDGDICRTGDADNSGEEHRTEESVRQWRSCGGDGEG